MGTVSSTHLARKPDLPPRRGLIKAQIFESFADNATYMVEVAMAKMKEYDRCARCFASSSLPRSDNSSGGTVKVAPSNLPQIAELTLFMTAKYK